MGEGRHLIGTVVAFYWLVHLILTLQPPHPPTFLLCDGLVVDTHFLAFCVASTIDLCARSGPMCLSTTGREPTTSHSTAGPTHAGGGGGRKSNDKSSPEETRGVELRYYDPFCVTLGVVVTGYVDIIGCK